MSAIERTAVVPRVEQQAPRDRKQTTAAARRRSCMAASHSPSPGLKGVLDQSAMGYTAPPLLGEPLAAKSNNLPGVRGAIGQRHRDAGRWNHSNVSQQSVHPRNLVQFFWAGGSSRHRPPHCGCFAPGRLVFDRRGAPDARASLSKRMTTSTRLTRDPGGSTGKSDTPMLWRTSIKVPSCSSRMWWCSEGSVSNTCSAPPVASLRIMPRSHRLRSVRCTVGSDTARSEALASE